MPPRLWLMGLITCLKLFPRFFVLLRPWPNWQIQGKVSWYDPLLRYLFVFINITCCKIMIWLLSLHALSLSNTKSESSQKHSFPRLSLTCQSSTLTMVYGWTEVNQIPGYFTIVEKQYTDILLLQLKNGYMIDLSIKYLYTKYKDLLLKTLQTLLLHTICPSINMDWQKKCATFFFFWS